MRSLVIGGLGFIGSHLVEKLLAEGDEVIILDNLSNNVVDSDFFNCEFIKNSIADYDFNIEVDTVYHLASVVGPTGILRYAGKMAYSMITDTKKVMDYCIKYSALMVDVSTSEVYGHSGTLTEMAHKECSGNYQVRTEYGMGKLAAEIMVCNKAKVSALRYQIIRPFNVSGPRQQPDGGFVLPRFVVAGLTEQPLTVYGNGQQVRSIAHVKDIVEGIYLAAHSECINEIWNIGNPNNLMTILELAHLTGSYFVSHEILKIDPKKLHGALFSEVGNKIPHITKAAEKLGFEPKYEIGNIISDLIGYYHERIQAGYYYKVL